jgi:ABC-type sugar transport system ATPase subunit
VLDAGDFKYDISAIAEPISKSSAGNELILGIRPEDIVIRERTTDRDAIEGEVDIVEPVGNRIIVDLRVGGHYLKANTRPMTLRPGEKVGILFDRNRIHIIDKKTEAVIV